MLTVDSAAGIELMTMYPPEIQGVLRALIELAGNPDHMKGMLAYMTRQSLMRAWGEFQQEHPLIVPPFTPTSRSRRPRATAQPRWQPGRLA